MQINMQLNNLTSQGMQQPQNMQGSKPPSPPPAESQELTEKEETTLDEIISNYDSDNFTEDDEESLLAELEEAGITPRMETVQYLEDAGFEISEPEGIPGNGFPSSNGIELSSEQKSEISDLIEQYNAGDIDSDSFQSDLETMIEGFMSDNGANYSGRFINRVA